MARNFPRGLLQYRPAAFAGMDDDSECYSGGSDYEDDPDQLYRVDAGHDSWGEVSQPIMGSKNKQTWTVIEHDTLAGLQDSALESVSGIMGCSRSTARKLLVHFRWDKEFLMCTVADKGEKYVYSAAGVTSMAETNEPTVSMTEVHCASCLSPVPRNKCTAMECGHYFCNDCWKQHLMVQIRDGNARRLKCMAFRCGAICDEEKVETILKGSHESLHRYLQALLESYIEDNQNVRWCPSAPHCGRAIQVDGDHYCEPCCHCDLMFCFKCGEQPHSPTTCEMWQIWKQKSQDESETKNWLTANTKLCPKCKKPVEKNGGCNLVVCHCGQSFCWLCGAATGTDHTWSRIYGHECGRWKEDMDKKVDEASRNHKRYMHYFERWKGHMDSLSKEDELRADVVKSVETLENADNELHDYSWIMSGLDQVLVARRILSNSYVFAFFMFGNAMFKAEISEEQNLANKELFEDQQQMLETELERLSHLLEDAQNPANKDMELRMLVINSKDSIHRRIVNLYSLLENDILAQLTQSPSSIAPYTGK